MNFLLLKEFIDKNGAKISGDEPINQVDSMSTSQSFTDDFVQLTRQGISRYSNYGRVYYQESDDEDVELPKKDKEKIHPKKENNLEEKKKKDKLIRKSMSKNIGKELTTNIKMDKPIGKMFSFKKSNLKETSRNKMDELIEDIFTKKDFDKEFISRNNSSDLRLNGIQPLDTIRETNPILIRKVINLEELIKKSDVTGEEKAIILNYILSMDMTDIPREYKEELKKKIK